MNRRSFLKVAAVAGIGTGVGYVRFRDSGREGRVFWRQMAVDVGGEPGSLVVMVEWRKDDGSVGLDFHPEYEDAFGDGAHVPESLPRRLRRRYGADEPYYLLRYEGHDCNGIPGDEGDGAAEVTRPEFNRNRVGECVKR